jgi:hypothetical protein
VRLRQALVLWWCVLISRSGSINLMPATKMHQYSNVEKALPAGGRRHGTAAAAAVTALHSSAERCIAARTVSVMHDARG